MAQASKSWNRHAEAMPSALSLMKNPIKRQLEITCGYLKPDMDVLEFGCGTGSTDVVNAPYVKDYRAIGPAIYLNTVLTVKYSP